MDHDEDPEEEEPEEEEPVSTESEKPRFRTNDFLFGDWSVKWDGQCDSAGPDKYHFASQSEDDSMKLLGKKPNLKEQVSSLEAHNHVAAGWLDRINMTEEQYRKDCDERGVKW